MPALAQLWKTAVTGQAQSWPLKTGWQRVSAQVTLKKVLRESVTQVLVWAVRKGLRMGSTERVKARYLRHQRLMNSAPPTILLQSLPL